jgi:hypothetical protein
VAPIIRANIDREVQVDAGFVSLYTNDTQIQLTPWDFRLIFGQIASVPTPDNPTIVVKAVGEIRMSPQHAKKIALILLTQIAHYEEKIGPIALPPD